MDDTSYKVQRFSDAGLKYPQKSQEISKFRRYLPQVICSLPISLMLANIGVALSYPTLVVQAFLLPDNRTDGFPQPDFFGHFHMDKHQTSLYVSICYLCQPIGSILGGLVIGLIGRKRLMMFFSFPVVAGWLLLFFSQSATWMYLSGAVLGIGIGCSEAPIATYIPESVESSVRGTLLGLAQGFLSVSFLLPYLVALGVPDWRWMALCHCVLPCLTLAAVLAVPETPSWLVSKGRLDDARRSLRWLRGGVRDEDVAEELESLVAFYRATSLSESTTTLPARSTDDLVPKSSSLTDTVRHMLSPRMRRPFLLVCFMFFLMFTSGLATMRPFLVPVVEHMGIHGNPEAASMQITLVGIGGSVVTFLVIKYTGKRLLSLSSLLVCGVMTTLLALCKAGVLPSQTAFHFLCVISFFNGSGIVPLPWILQGEIYPYRGRGLASGVAAAFSYLVGFVCTNNFIPVSEAIGLEGVFFLFTCCNLVGFSTVYFTMPETEGKTFEQIEEFYRETEARGR